MKIIGAGLSGLLAAHAFPNAEVIEQAPAPEDIQQHKALLRFKTRKVADLTGIEFKPVTVRKGIWDGHFIEPSIQAANQYSYKVIGGIEDRSIWNLDPVTRYIAPEDFYPKLLENVWPRIRWGESFNLSATVLDEAPIISTIPMKHAVHVDGADFDYAPIHVKRYRLERANVYQTVYYPTLGHSMYRASITGNLLIVEFVATPAGPWESDLIDSMGLDASMMEPLDEAKQRYGKISPIDAEQRKAALAKLTREQGIYSLGRFATWRNILLDDVVDDIAVIKRLMRANQYDATLAAL